MSTLGTARPTILDVARATDPSGKIAKPAGVLMQYNDILDDIPWYEGNSSMGNLTTIQSSKASPSLRALNAGVTPTKSTTSQINDACSILENRSQIDINVANINGNAVAYRAMQDEMMIAGFGDSLAEHLIYGNSADDPSEFNGLATRYFTLGSTYTTSSQVIDAGGTGSDNTSIWLVNWGPNKVFGLYPKGSKAGLQIEDLGIKDIIENVTTMSTFRAYVTWMQWMCGLCVADYRNVVRIANIDVSNLNTASDSSDTSANIIKYMSQALDLLPPDANGTPVFYMRNSTRAMLRVKMNDKSNLYLKDEQITSPNSITRRPILTFQGVPVRRVDSILATESQITTATA
jgi:hypothetical protein